MQALVQMQERRKLHQKMASQKPEQALQAPQMTRQMKKHQMQGLQRRLQTCWSHQMQGQGHQMQVLQLGRRKQGLHQMQGVHQRLEQVHQRLEQVHLEILLVPQSLSVNRLKERRVLPPVADPNGVPFNIRFRKCSNDFLADEMRNSIARIFVL
jgi:hypothetical protein